jgi:hypothetical protein
MDRFCLSGGAVLRVGYRRERAVLLLVSSPRYRIRGVRVGTSTRTLRRRLGPSRGVRIGKNRWYVRRGTRSRLVFKTRGGRVREVGLAERGPTAGRKRAKRFLSSFGAPRRSARRD